MADVDREPCCGHSAFHHEHISFRGASMSYCWKCKDPGDACYMMVVVP